MTATQRDKNNIIQCLNKLLFYNFKTQYDNTLYNTQKCWVSIHSNTVVWNLLTQMAVLGMLLYLVENPAVILSNGVTIDI